MIRRCGAIALPDGSALFRVWAPRAGHVDLVLIDGDRRRALRMEPEERGFFRRHEPNVRDGQRYSFRLDGGPERPDPASLWQPDGVHVPSAVVRTERFGWTDHAWRGVPRADLVFYELHAGTFTPEGTFEAVVPRLRQLRELGVTAVEVMPVAQFPGARNWGYDGVHPYAAQSTYGGPHGLQRLVDACHREGLAAFLDVVYNHFGPEGNYLNEFGPYFTDRYRTPWGQAVNYDAAGSDAVRDFVLDNARMWLEEFHFDGLRLDAVHSIFDLGPRHILRALKDVADGVAGRSGRRIHLIAESDLNDVRILLPPERGGYGIDGQWSDDFHHCVHALLTGEHQGYYADFGEPGQLADVLRDPFLYAGIFSPHRDRKHGASAEGLPGDRFVVMVQNHDQVGNRARGDRLSTLVAPEGQRLSACLMLLSPHLPLLFMGEEYGEHNPFPFFCSFDDPRLIESVRAGRANEFAAFAWQGHVPDPQAEETFASARLSWSWPEGSPGAGLRQLYADLLRARREWPALRDFERRRSRLLPRDKPCVLELVRGEGAESVAAYFNLTRERQRLPDGVNGRRLFSSESARYAGGRSDDAERRELLPYECVVFGPEGVRAVG